MAGNKRPSFLKRQKEQARQARAIEKRQQRQARREARANGTLPQDDIESLEDTEGMDIDSLEEGEGPDEGADSVDDADESSPGKG